MKLTYDIREVDAFEASHIRFADIDSGNYTATLIEKQSGGRVKILEDDGDSGSVQIVSLEHANDLIKALKKAIDLNWIE